ncbi:hypothetical protein TDB9533_00750 [Thalassocella blandensis]|nr:hypothetical protein TDB9533_00750 [Thalassocella blandensis]
MNEIENLSWRNIESSLDTYGNAVLPGLLSADQCDALTSLYSQESNFRKRVVMAKHGFGLGEYKYFSYPLPALLEQLRHALFRNLVPIANRWNQQMGLPVLFPPELSEYLETCHESGQLQPTPLILRYKESHYNCLHQDLYGDLIFPLQTAILLSDPGTDFLGGEFVMTENSANRQRAEVISLNKGDAVIFTVKHRPVSAQRRTRHKTAFFKKVAMRHGVSRILRGQRYAIGLIFHDAK